MKLLIAILALLTLLSCHPQNDDFVTDPAGFLSEKEKNHISRYHDALLKDGNIHFMLVILPAASRDINKDAVKLFEDFRLGEATRGARGVLLLIDPTGKRVRVEIGYDLEGAFPDGFVGYLEEQQMTPFFKTGDVAQGIEATVELLVSRAFDETAFDLAELDSSSPHLSGGGGARIEVDIGSAPAPSKNRASTSDYPPGETPEETFKSYLSVLADYVNDPDLDIYTQSTRSMFADWTVTKAQQEEELKRIQGGLGNHRVLISGKFAVIRFSAVQRRLPPYFLVKGFEGWQLDFSVMKDNIAFNHKNQWHFKHIPENFEFAFNDWKFDEHGFPYNR